MCGVWVDTQKVSRSPSQRAIAPRTSIGHGATRGLRVRCRTTTSQVSGACPPLCDTSKATFEPTSGNSRTSPSTAWTGSTTTGSGS